MTDARWHNLEHRFSGWEHFMHEPDAFTAWRILSEQRGWKKSTFVYGDRGMTLCFDEQEAIERWGVFYEDLAKAKALCTGEIEVIKMWEVSS